jgi:multicomponent Na+:H+ antiporter subunit C
VTQVVLAVALGALATVGTFLLLRRDVVRVVWGVVILGQTANVYLVTMGGLTGTAPILEHGGETAGVTDPLVQALVLTAIVIGFGTTAFALVLTYRLYQEHGTLDLRELAGGGHPAGAGPAGVQADVAAGTKRVEDDGSAGDEPATDGGVDTPTGDAGVDTPTGDAGVDTAATGRGGARDGGTPDERDGAGPPGWHGDGDPDAGGGDGG